MNKGPGGDATVTIAHSFRTKHLAEVCSRAETHPHRRHRPPEFVRADFVKMRLNAVVIDVGINRVEDPASPKGYKIVGDVAFAEVAPKCRAITPVPGGVGPMTIAMLMANTIASAERFAGVANRGEIEHPVNYEEAPPIFGQPLKMTRLLCTFTNKAQHAWNANGVQSSSPGLARRVGAPTLGS